MAQQMTAATGHGLGRPTKKTLAGICATLALVVVWLYWPTSHHEFINYDDQDYVTENLIVQQGLSWEGLSWAFTTSHAGNWHPLTWLTHMMDCGIYGMNPGGHHATNVALHTLNSILLLLLLVQLTGLPWQSAFVAALFALHPLRVESVAWVSERKDVLSAFFGLLTLMAYVRYASESKVSGLKSKAWYGVALGLFASGLMSKPMLVTWPFVLLLLDIWPLHRVSIAMPTVDWPGLKKLLFEKIPFFALSIVASAVTLLVQQAAGAVTTAEALPIGTRLGNALISYTGYLEKMFWPNKLAVLYPYSQALPLNALIFASAVLLGISVLVIRSRQSRPYLLIGWLWYLGTLVPVVGLVQVGQQAMADRYTYLPSIGILIMLVWGMAELYKTKAIRIAGVTVGLLTLGGLAAATHQQLRHWRDSEALFAHVVAVTDNNAVAHYNLGSALAVKGQVAEAMGHFQEALRINPRHQEAHSDLGLALVLAGKIEEGITHYEQAIAINPKRDKPYFNLARALTLLGHKAEAIVNYEKVLELNPHHAEARMALAIHLGELGRWEEAAAQFDILARQFPNEAEVFWQYGNLRRSRGDNPGAIEQYTKALPLAPDNADLHDQFGLALALNGQTEPAIKHFQEAVRLHPTANHYYHLGLALNSGGLSEQAEAAYREALKMEPTLLEALNELAWMRATHPDPKLRSGAEAVQLAEQAVQLTEGREARFLGTLDAAYAEAGRFDDAITTARKTLTAAQAQGQPQLAAAAETRLQLYQTKTPYRQTAAQ